MLKHFGVPVSDFVLVSGTTFAVIFREFGEACLVKGRGGEIVLTSINFCRCPYAVLGIRLAKPMVQSRPHIYPAV